MAVFKCASCDEEWEGIDGHCWYCGRFGAVVLHKTMIDKISDNPINELTNDEVKQAGEIIDEGNKTKDSETDRQDT